MIFIGQEKLQKKTANTNIHSSTTCHFLNDIIYIFPHEVKKIIQINKTSDGK